MAVLIVLVLAVNLCHALYHCTADDRTPDERGGSFTVLAVTFALLAYYTYTVTQ